MLADPISDFITRIKNAYLARHNELVMPHSKLKQAIATIMMDEGYLEAVEVEGELPKLTLKLKLHYLNHKPAVTGIKRISKPGRRLYTSVNDIPKTLGGYGITIVSTSKGLLTDRQARKKSVGGELICQVW